MPFQFWPGNHLRTTLLVYYRFVIYLVFSAFMWTTMGDCIECKKCFAVCTIAATFHSLKPLLAWQSWQGCGPKSSAKSPKWCWGWDLGVKVLMHFVNLAVNITCCALVLFSDIGICMASCAYVSDKLNECTQLFRQSLIVRGPLNHFLSPRFQHTKTVLFL